MTSVYPSTTTACDRLGDLLLRQIDAVEDVALLVDGRLSRVEVLRVDPVVVVEPPRAEADDISEQVADRPHQPAAESVVRRRSAQCDQPGDDELVVAESPLTQVLPQRLARTRRIADAETDCGFAVEVSLVQEPAAGYRLRRLGQLLGVESGGVPMGLDQSGSLFSVWLRCGAGSGFLVAQLHADLDRKPLERLGERQLLDLLDKPDDVSALVAPEAEVHASSRCDVERRCLLVVEGAQSLQRAATRIAQGHVLADDLLDPRLLADRRDVLVADPPSHVVESTSQAALDSAGAALVHS